MKRNEIIAVVLLVLVLTAVGVGASTFMSAQDLAKVQAGLTKQLNSSSTRLSTDVKDVKGVAQTMLPAEKGSAKELASSGFLWSKGRLIVSPEGDTVPMFEVDPSKPTVAITASLTVDGASVLGDVDANELKATQVTADALTNTNQSWQVDENGAMTADSASIKNNATVGGALTVSGGPFLVGSEGSGGYLKFVPGSGKGKGVMAVIGELHVNDLFASTTMTMRNNVDVTGTLSARDFRTESGKFVADSAGNVTAAGLSVKGHAKISDIDAGSVTTGKLSAADANIKSLTAGSITATGSLNSATGLNVAGDKLRINSLGSVLMKGDLVASGTVDASAVNADTVKAKTLLVTDATGASTKFRVDTSGNGYLAGTLTVDGSIKGNDFATNSGKFFVDSSGNTTATGDTNIGGRLKAGSGGFSVDGSGAVIAKTTTVNGDETVSNDVSVGNDVNVGNDLRVTGLIYGTLAGGGSLTKANLVASNSLSVGSSDFTVDSSGNTVVGGTLKVTGDSTFSGKVAVSGDSSFASNVAVTGDLSAGNIKHGVATISGTTVSVSVSGMPSDASVVVTPHFSTTNPYWVTVSSGTFTIHGDAGDFSWVAMW